MVDLPIKVVILHSYVSLPDGSRLFTVHHHCHPHWNVLFGGISYIQIQFGAEFEMFKAYNDLRCTAQHTVGGPAVG